MGKRIVLALDGELFLVLHLMIAGRLRWLAASAKPPARITLAVFEFATGQLVLTEAGTKRRASLHLVHGKVALTQFDMGGLEVDGSSPEEFASRVTRENHTLKRALTDPHLFSGIGNAYSDEILHRARLSPLALTQKLSGDELVRLACGGDRDVARLDRALAPRGEGRLSGKGHGVPSADGRARTLRGALSRLRRAGAAHRVRGERGQLLRALPDQRGRPCRSRAVAPAAQILPAKARRYVAAAARVARTCQRRGCDRCKRVRIPYVRGVRTTCARRCPRGRGGRGRRAAPCRTRRAAACACRAGGSPRAAR